MTVVYAATPYAGTATRPVRSTARYCPYVRWRLKRQTTSRGSRSTASSAKYRRARLGPKSLEQAIKDLIVIRTGRADAMLAIELTHRELIVCGSAPGDYVKQLRRKGLEVLHSGHQTTIECNIQIVVHPPGPKEPTDAVGEPSSSPESM